VVNDRFAHGNPKGHRDVLQIMTEYRDQNGQGIAKDVMQMECLSPVLAGSDTTAASLRVAVLYIATNTVVRRKLVAELDEAERAGLLSSPAKFNQLKELHYLPAVIKEVLRM
jgi:cytochrome P450